jgi:hypothetical protein
VQLVGIKYVIYYNYLFNFLLSKKSKLVERNQMFLFKILIFLLILSPFGFYCPGRQHKSPPIILPPTPLCTHARTQAHTLWSIKYLRQRESIKCTGLQHSWKGHNCEIFQNAFWYFLWLIRHYAYLTRCGWQVAAYSVNINLYMSEMQLAPIWQFHKHIFRKIYLNAHGIEIQIDSKARNLFTKLGYICLEYEK